MQKMPTLLHCIWLSTEESSIFTVFCLHNFSLMSMYKVAEGTMKVVEARKRKQTFQNKIQYAEEAMVEVTYYI